ncbi:conserved exported hypothetical protein [Candidatus Zixiibacteriota bacterium]|nr:conserved exported hypothetical protein [candidate division Zixibacteria bacterium]
MKKVAIIQILFLLTFGIVSSATLSTEYQQDLVGRLEFLRGTGPQPASIFNSAEIPHCGTPITFETFINRNDLNAPYKMQAIQLSNRPNLPNSYASPAGNFLVHYTTLGSDSVYQSSVDLIGPNGTAGADGVPDYVNKIGQIADSVWNFEVNHLGYPAPPSDGFYTAGGTSAYDIYIINLGSTYYGYTPGDSAISSQRATSFIVIDNDYQFPPYSNRPLDAARVTLAHEFFHAIHFGLDYTEYDGPPSDAKLYWWEMSSTWMEEMAYDNINDYYGYLPYYFGYPWVSLLDFSAGYPLHPYGAMVFPLYLTQKFDTAIVKYIWFNCRDMGVGPNFLEAADSGISEISGGEYHLREAFAEFSMWNLFTGTRSSRAPAGYKFEEAVNYPLIPDSLFITHDSIPFLMGWPWIKDTTALVPDIPQSKLNIYKAHIPQNLAAEYIAINDVYRIPDTLRIGFFGIYSSTLGLGWNLGTAMEPLSGSTPYQVSVNYQSPPLSTISKVWTTPGNFRLYAAASVVTTNHSANPGSFGFGYSVNDTALGVMSSMQITPPYPNPALSGNDSVYFPLSLLSGERGVFNVKMSVTLFDIAGVKIKTMDTNLYNFPLFKDMKYPVIAWPLDNGQGKKVAPGVYLALCRVTFDDGTPEQVRKFKLAVIK